LPFSNEGFAVSPGRTVNVGLMSTTNPLADPIISSVAVVLSVPLFELYALLWRVGVVEIVGTDRGPRRGSRRASGAAGPRGPICPDPSAHGSGRPRRRSPQRPHPAPAPTPGDRAAFRQAVG
jgi:hypothetical protein